MGILQLVLVVFVASAAGGPVQVSKHVDLFNNAASSKIVGGYNANRHQFPYQISIHVRGNHVCGGTLVRENWVVTAGHCVDPFYNVYEVVMGLLNQREEHEDVQRSNVSRIIVHNGYPGGVARNDIALLELTTSAKLTEAVQLASLDVQSYCGTSKHGFVSGWGYTTATNQETPVPLQWAKLPIITEEKCKENLKQTVGKPELLDETMICLVTNEDAGQSACNGDSGGPLVVYRQKVPLLIGVASWTVVPCGGNPLFPSVYTNVCSHLDFINSIIG